MTDQKLSPQDEYNQLDTRLRQLYHGLTHHRLPHVKRQRLEAFERQGLTPQQILEQPSPMDPIFIEAHARVLPRMLKLREENPDLAMRIMPTRKLSPGEQDVHDTMEKVDARIAEVLAQHLPVYIDYEFDPDPMELQGFTSSPHVWSVVDVEVPNFVLNLSDTEAEAVAFAEANGLPVTEIRRG